ncbi:MAG: hypothetical protein IT315_05780 [Anaerolineales bacterium]|nr:hypothetical protein [Anaerolineales bacterium]
MNINKARKASKIVQASAKVGTCINDTRQLLALNGKTPSQVGKMAMFG